MDNTQCNNLAELTRHIAQIQSLTTGLKAIAWGAFSFEVERGKSAYVGNLLAEIGKQCDIATGAAGKIVAAGELLQEELDVIEGDAK